MACIISARKVSKIQPEWNSSGLESLTDCQLTEEIKTCFEKLYRTYERNFGKPYQSAQSNQHNKENEEESLTISAKVSTLSKVVLVSQVPDHISEFTKSYLDSHNTTRSDEQTPTHLEEKASEKY